MRTYFIVAFNLLFFISYAEVWTLEQCLVQAIDKNIQIKQAELQQKLAESNLFQSSFQMFSPRINTDVTGSANFGRFVDPTTNQFVNQQQTTYSGGLSAQLTLFSGLSQLYSIKQNKMNVESSKFDSENTRNNVLLTITRSFLQILLSKEELNSVTQQLTVSQQQLQQAQILFETGNVPKGNVLDAEAQLAQDSLRYVATKNALDIAKLTLAILIQVEPTPDFDVATPNIDVPAENIFETETADQVYKMALQNQPSIKSAYFKERSAKYQLGAAKGLQYPTLTLFSNFRTNYSSGFKDFSTQAVPGAFDTLGFYLGSPITSPKFELVTSDISLTKQIEQNLAKIVGVSLNIPILNGWQARTNIKNAKLNYSNAKLNQLQAENTLKQDVYTAYADARNAHQTFLSSNKSAIAFQKSLEYNQERYEVGALNSLQFNTARVNYANATIQQIRNKYDYIFKLKVLDFYKGIPITLN